MVVNKEGDALLHLPRTEALQQEDMGVGPESRRKGADPHREEGLAHYLQCMPSLHAIDNHNAKAITSDSCMHPDERTMSLDPFKNDRLCGCLWHAKAGC